MKTKCCCIRERLTKVLDELILEIDETCIEDFSRLHPLVLKSYALLKEAKPMLGHSCKPLTTEEGVCL